MRRSRERSITTLLRASASKQQPCADGALVIKEGQSGASSSQALPPPSRAAAAAAEDDDVLNVLGVTGKCSGGRSGDRTRTESRRSDEALCAASAKAASNGLDMASVKAMPDDASTAGAK